MFRGPTGSSSSVLGIRALIHQEMGATTPGDDSDIDGWEGLWVVGSQGRG